jgi:hypothetical protein
MHMRGRPHRRGAATGVRSWQASLRIVSPLKRDISHLALRSSVDILISNTMVVRRLNVKQLRAQNVILYSYRELTPAQNAVESDKALRYIQQLDEARCAGRWKDVPELCRKVEKHASHRQCQRLSPRRRRTGLTTPRPDNHRALRSTDSHILRSATLDRRLLFVRIQRPSSDCSDTPCGD